MDTTAIVNTNYSQFALPETTQLDSRVTGGVNWLLGAYTAVQ